jgi:hypothetical protein
MINRHKNPKWWNSEYDSIWRRVGMVMRELIQTKAAGDQLYEDLEPAYRFGFGARITFGNLDWDANFETHLAEAWRAVTPARKQKWEDDRDAILDGWNFGAKVLKERRKKSLLFPKIGQNNFLAHRIAEGLPA